MQRYAFINDRSCKTEMIPFSQDLALSLNDKCRADIIYFDFSQDLAMSLNDKCRADIIYFDFAKAFDSVSHDLIFYKLKNNSNINLLLLKFIKSYFEGRLQQVGMFISKYTQQKFHFSYLFLFFKLHHHLN